MATNQQSLLRQWHMLRMVPRAPAKISASELYARLCASDFTVSKRTIERDLQELSAVFPSSSTNGIGLTAGAGCAKHRASTFLA